MIKSFMKLDSAGGIILRVAAACLAVLKSGAHATQAVVLGYIVLHLGLPRVR